VIFATSKAATFILTLVLYLVHLGINWTVHHFSRKDTFDDFLRFGSELAFVGMCFFGTALTNPNSIFNSWTAHPLDKNWAIAVAILLFVFFELVAVWHYKMYLKKPRSKRSTKSSQQLWRVGVSYAFGFVAFCAGLSML
jgi:hypothetical protein